MDKILIFIPAYQCAKQIIRVISQLSKKIEGVIDTVILIDNRSADETLKVAIETAKRTFQTCHFFAIKNDNNYGLGGSHKAAMRYAVEHDFDHLVVLHGDDQASFKDIAQHLHSGIYKDYDCFLGARFMKGSKLEGYSRFRTLGNIVYNLLFSAVAGIRIYDLGSGLNLYKVSVLKEFYYRRFPDDLTFNYAMLLASVLKKQKIGFFPISWREEDQVSNVKLFRQAFKVLGILGNFLFLRKYFLEKDFREKRFERYDGEVVYAKQSVQA